MKRISLNVVTDGLRRQGHSQIPQSNQKTIADSSGIHVASSRTGVAKVFTIKDGYIQSQAQLSGLLQEQCTEETFRWPSSNNGDSVAVVQGKVFFINVLNQLVAC